ncbi:molybdopterin molybdotransferase MoeA [Synoicihabitans lomoniglobus]|uniref:Molybdopterin molybdenumtransferase n=1 Tax=Synoicihabitans lomoniglobus TaxID=2909285 RepID=A0AAF0CMI4_9BACT|nr:molybdopterin molybdotransferase MoeA [Opitutaceae bacterium LMO-M01]WED64173.1 molybdopterin molybdotransferase MoeA [Opitutaceae bacterium LMO-M01]
MLATPTAATATIATHLTVLSTEDCPLSAAHGRILRGPVSADRPLPPYNRVTMDGYAVNSADWSSDSSRGLRITGFQAAGMMAQTLAATGLAIEIATGAVLPMGADAIVPYEEVERTDDTVKLAATATCQPGQNIHRLGSDVATGTALIPAGTRLTGADIAVAATVGAAQLRVSARPTVAIISTGDELVEVDARHVAPHQIRRSNDHALRAALLQSGLTARIERFHLRDHRTEIDASLRHILAEFDVVIISGGVSKGKLDHLPQALADLGVTQHLRGIAQRPGKPMWFGTTPRRTPVFALPGNPVSTYTCLHRYVLPALRHMAGQTPAQPETAILAETFKFPRPLAFMLPVKVGTTDDGRNIARPAPFNTSGDLGGLLGTDGFVELPAETDTFAAGTPVTLWRWT